MKTIPLAVVGVLLVAIFSAPPSEAQTIVPPTAKEFQKRGISSGGGLGTGTGVGVGIEEKDPQPRKTVTVYYTTVSKSREWTNTAGKNMTAQLLAFAAPKPGEGGPVQVIKDGKIRFLLSNAKKPIDYPLDQLSQPDQIFVKAIAQAASRGAPNPAAAKTEEGAKSGGKE